MASSNPTLLLTANKDIERFLSKVNIPDDPDACWEWQEALFGNHYGQFRYGQKKVGAHRWIYQQVCGVALPCDVVVRHKCDNRKCVNPRHLLQGTVMENIQDKVARCRQHRGESHPCAKLSVAQVLEIRAIYKTTGLSQQKIAAQFGVAQTNIGYIIRAKTWAHI